MENKAEIGHLAQRIQLHERGSAAGVPILASSSVSQAAIDEAAARICKLLTNRVIADNLQRCGIHLEIIAPCEKASSLPQYSHLLAPEQGSARDAFDTRGRAYGGVYPCIDEDNLLSLPSDRFDDHRDILSHEFAHTILHFGLDQEYYSRLCDLFERQKSLWTGMYAATNADEYFAEATMWFVGSRGDYGSAPPPSICAGRAWLAAHDAEIDAFLQDIYGADGIESKVTEHVSVHELRVMTLSKFCHAHVDMSTKEDGPKCQLVVRNSGQHTWRMFWVSRTGDKHWYQDIYPGDTKGQETYQGHTWVFESESGHIAYGACANQICFLDLKSVA